MSNYPFSSTEAVRRQFIDGLSGLVGSPDKLPKLGHFILVAANALFDSEIYEQTASKLEQSFTDLRARLHDQLSNGRLLSDADDDQLVFLKLALIGWKGLRLTEPRQAPIFRIGDSERK